MPAQAGIQEWRGLNAQPWIPAFAGMTKTSFRSSSSYF